MKKKLLLTFLIVLFVTGCGNKNEDIIEVKETVYECEDGYILGYDNKCEKTTIVSSSINTSCPDGYVLNNNVCQIEDLKVVSIGDVTCDPGYQYDSLRNVCMSTQTTSAYYDYDCPNDFIKYNNKCYLYLGDDPIYGQNNFYAVCIYGTITSIGIVNPTSYCRYYIINDLIKSAPKCPNNYTYLRGEICTSTEWKKVNVELNCPSGYIKKDEYTCYRLLTVSPNISYSCPDGYVLEKEMCSKTEYMDAIIKE